MKILHTSDWHLGRNFGTVPLHDVQEEFCRWLVELAVERGVDVVIVAGDIFDWHIPPNDSIRLWKRTLVAFADAGIKVVAIAGNHDGADRVSAADGLTDALGIHIRGGFDRVGDVIRIDDEHGPVDFVVIPFLEPLLAPSTWRDELKEKDLPRSQEGVLRIAMERAESSDRSNRSVVVAHAFVSGSSAPATAESEKRLSIGAAEMVPVDIFDGHSYVALGHLHRPQKVQHDTVRYSGTPLPYSFSETDRKSVVLVDLDADGGVAIETVDVPLGRPVVKLTDTIEKLLDDPKYDEFTDHFVLADLEDLEYVTDARDRLMTRFPHVVEIRISVRDRTSPEGEGTAESTSSRAQLEPIDAAIAFWNDIKGADPTEAEHEVLVAGFDAVRAAEGDR